MGQDIGYTVYSRFWDMLNFTGRKVFDLHSPWIIAARHTRPISEAALLIGATIDDDAY